MTPDESTSATLSIPPWKKKERPDLGTQTDRGIRHFVSSKDFPDEIKFLLPDQRRPGSGPERFAGNAADDPSGA